MTNSLKYSYQTLIKWAEAAVHSGWLAQDNLKQLRQLENKTVDDLFIENECKPLIIAFFGGTGVGKSSLLNRLSGESLAKVGVERPTSHEVTLYLHKDCSPKQLPQKFPSDKTRIVFHNNEQRRFVGWLDLPDIDSTSQENREMVNLWLPYIDWLIYVVSPEKYKDDVGWRYLEKYGGYHAWLFIMNHWDRGSPEQIEDLRHLLLAEGFENPHILRTDCLKPGDNDDFKQLEFIIQGAINKYGLDLLQQINIKAGLSDLLQHIEMFKDRIGTEKQWNKTAQDWDEALDSQIRKISDVMTFSIKTLPLKSLLQRSGEEKQKGNAFENYSQMVEPISNLIWSKRCEVLLNDLQAMLLNCSQQNNIPVEVVAAQLNMSVHSDSNDINDIKNVLEEHLIKALARPGIPIQRIAYKATGLISWQLPLLAAMWAGYYVVIGFQTSIKGEKDFLGLSFAIHTALLIFLSWFTPWLLHVKLRPKIITAAKIGLRHGIISIEHLLKKRYRDLSDRLREESIEYHQELEQFRKEIKRLQQESASHPETFIKDFLPGNDSSPHSL